MSAAGKPIEKNNRSPISRRGSKTAVAEDLAAERGTRRTSTGRKKKYRSREKKSPALIPAGKEDHG